MTTFRAEFCTYAFVQGTCGSHFSPVPSLHNILWSTTVLHDMYSSLINELEKSWKKREKSYTTIVVSVLTAGLHLLC